MVLKKRKALMLFLFAFLLINVAFMQLFSGQFLTASSLGNNESIDMEASFNESKNSLQVDIVTDGDYEFQVWAKAHSILHTVKWDENDLNTADTNSYIWQLLAGFNQVNDKQVLIPEESLNSYNIDNYYYFLVRAKDAEGNIIEYYKAISVLNTGNYITDIKLNEVAIDEINYLEANETAYLQVSTSLQGQVSLFDGVKTISNENGLFSIIVKDGLNTYTIKTGAGQQDILINGYNRLIDYTKINDVIIKENPEGDYIAFGEKIPSASSGYINIVASQVGNGSNVTARIKTGNIILKNDINVNTDVNFDLSDSGLSFGVYLIRAEIVNDFQVVEDYFDFYYNYSRNTDIPTVEAQLTNKGNGKYTINVTNTDNFGEEEVLYQFLKWDVKGEYVIRNYSESSSIDLDLKLKGNYRIEVRAKSTSSTTFEARTYIDVNYNDESQTINSDIVITQNGKTVENYYDGTPYKITVNTDIETDALQYRFIISSKGMWRVEEIYSPSNCFTWIPRKTGSFTILVYINHLNNYGFADYIYASQTINVEHYVAPEVIDLEGLIDVELDHTLTSENGVYNSIAYSFNQDKLKQALNISDTEILSITDKDTQSSLNTESITYGERNLEVETLNAIYNFKALFVSLIINDAADLDLMGDMLKASVTIDGRIQIQKATETKEAIETDKMFTDGYFILGDDIDYLNKIYTKAPEIFVNNVGKELLLVNSQKTGVDGYGFEGVFDGRGHTIYNINLTAVKATSSFNQLSRTGLFTAIAKNGIVKNVAFQVNKMGNFGVNGDEIREIARIYYAGLAFENYGLIENISYLVEECHFNTYGGILTMQPGNSNGTYSNITAYVKKYINYGEADKRNGILVGFARVKLDVNNVYCVVEESLAGGNGAVLEWTWASNGGKDASIYFAQTGRDVYRFDSLEDFVAKKSVTISQGVKTYVEDTNMPNTTKFTDHWAMDNGQLDISYGITLFESTRTLIENESITTISSKIS